MVQVDQSFQNSIPAVKSVKETIIKATNHPNAELGFFPLSNFDRLLNGIPVRIFYAYSKPSTEDFSSISDTIKSSLSQALDHFFPFSGQILASSTGEPELLCNNKGIRLLEASASISLSELDFYNLSKSLRNLIVPVDHREFLLTVQITRYECGGFSISWTFDHVLADAVGFIKFLSTCCEIALSKKHWTPLTPNLDRQIFRPRSPPSYNKSIEHHYNVVDMNNMISMLPPDCAMQGHLYFVSGSTLEALKSASKRSRTIALSSYLWKFMAKAFDKGNNTHCKMGWSVDGRMRIDENSERILNFAGNVVSMAIGEASIEDLKERSIEYIANVASRVVNEVANRAHFLDLIDWVECKRPARVLPTAMLEASVPAIVVSSCHDMEVMKMDFGFGLPWVGTFVSALDQMCAGYVTFVSSGRSDGSWFVSAFIWPGLARELELDPDHVFEPITADHLNLSLMGGNTLKVLP